MRAPVLAIVALALTTGFGADSYDELLKRFEYDRASALDVREAGVQDRGGVKVHDISYVSPKGGRVPAYLVEPGSGGKHAAIIWGHWYWDGSPARNRSEFLDEATAIAKAGVVSLMIDGPVARPGYVADNTPLNEKQIADRIQTIVDMRRAADLLLARPDVDPSRLAYVGHSYNAETGGFLAGIDKRFRAFVLMAGSLSDQVDRRSQEYQNARQRIGPERWDAFMRKYDWLDPGQFVSHAAPAAVFMQYATEESFLTPARAREYAALVSEPKQFKLYESNHALNAQARRDRLEFLQKQLRLGPIDWEAVARVPQLVQPPPPARPADVHSQDAIIGALYDVISGPGGQKRNWDRFRSLFAPGARLIPTGRRPDGSGTMRVLIPDEYASGIGPRLEERGFFEREVARTSEEFGNIVQAFSTYESRHAAGDSQPFARGINSIQLVNDGTRWWVMTVLWDSERPDNPIPAKYLKKSGS